MRPVVAASRLPARSGSFLPRCGERRSKSGFDPMPPLARMESGRWLGTPRTRKQPLATQDPNFRFGQRQCRDRGHSSFAVEWHARVPIALSPSFSKTDAGRDALGRTYYSITWSARTKRSFSTLAPRARIANRRARCSCSDVPRQPKVPMAPGYFTSSNFPVSTS